MRFLDDKFSSLRLLLCLLSTGLGDMEISFQANSKVKEEKNKTKPKNKTNPPQVNLTCSRGSVDQRQHDDWDLLFKLCLAA